MVDYKLLLITADNKLLVTDGDAIIKIGYTDDTSDSTKKDSIKKSLKDTYNIDISTSRIVFCKKGGSDDVVFVIISSSEKETVAKIAGYKFIALKDNNSPFSIPNPVSVDAIVAEYGSENLGKCLKEAKTKLSSTLLTNNDDDYDKIPIRNIFGFIIGYQRVRRRSVNYIPSILLPFDGFYIPTVRYSSPRTKISGLFNDLNKNVSNALQSSSGSPKVPRLPSSPNSSPKITRQRSSSRSSSSRSRRGGYYEKYMKYKLKYLALKKQLF
jgi:hypothetical protein